MPIVPLIVPVFNKNVRIHVTEVAASMLNVVWEITNLFASVSTVTPEIRMLAVVLKKVSDAWCLQWRELVFIWYSISLVWFCLFLLFPLSLKYWKIWIETPYTHKSLIKSQYTTSQLKFAIRAPVLQMLFVENVMVLGPVLACLVTLVILMLTVNRNACQIQNVPMTKPALIISVWKRVPLMAFVVVSLNVVSWITHLCVIVSLDSLAIHLLNVTRIVNIFHHVRRKTYKHKTFIH